MAKKGVKSRECSTEYCQKKGATRKIKDEEKFREFVKEHQDKT